MILGIGVDVVDVSRVARMLERHGERVVARLLTPWEAEALRERPDRAEAIAVRLAAKEAAYKAMTGNDLARAVSWQDVEVRNNEHGAPSLVFHGRAEQRIAELGAANAWVSLTHSQTSAIAMVVLERA